MDSLKIVHAQFLPTDLQNIVSDVGDIGVLGPEVDRLLANGCQGGRNQCFIHLPVRPGIAVRCTTSRIGLKDGENDHRIGRQQILPDEGIHCAFQNGNGVGETVVRFRVLCPKHTPFSNQLVAQ